MELRFIITKKRVSGCVFHREIWIGVPIFIELRQRVCISDMSVCVIRHSWAPRPRPFALGRANILTLLLAARVLYISHEKFRAPIWWIASDWVGQNQSAGFNNSKVGARGDSSPSVWTVWRPEMAWNWCDCPLLFYSSTVAAHQVGASSFPWRWTVLDIMIMSRWISLSQKFVFL